MTRYLVHYSGRVQGVGFRWTSANLARGFAVAGYVQNLPDGRVRLEAQGEKREVQALLDAIDGEMAGKIRGKDIAELEADPALGVPGRPDAFAVRR